MRRGRVANFKRVLLMGVLLVAAVGAYVALDDEDAPRHAPTLEQMADEIGAEVMTHLYRGHVAGRSGEIMLVPKPHNYLTGEWDLRKLGTDTPETFVSHPNPWSYLARVPLVFYGPGYAPEALEVSIDADLTDVAPTYARLLDLEKFEADGRALDEILTKKSSPRVILTVVIDGGGWNVLNRYRESWRTIARLASAGTMYTNATIGSAPSLTGPVHSNLGTGRYPITHGVPTNPWLGLAHPGTLRVPTLSELWDESTGNKAIVAMMGYEDPHLGMIGHGAQRDGGDRDIAVFWDVDKFAWRTGEQFYELPDYLVPPDLDALETYERGLDLEDGAVDDAWRGHGIHLAREATPAFATFTGDAVVQIMRNEPLGKDAITDLLWVEMKMPDAAGHVWNMVSPEEEEVLREVDRQIARFKSELDGSVGKGNYLIVISADHGQEPFAEVTGGWRINFRELARDLESEFGSVVEKVTLLDLQIDRSRIGSEGPTLLDVARYIGTYTLEENIPDGAPGADRVSPDRLNERLFAGAFPTDFLQELTPQKLKSFGDSAYPEGALSRR
ncbi:MAG: alkaline phosphatase family protein [Actinomycetota bacterium]|nr:alkaline phosphatase family protein [Actinomycetota bacterium]